MVAGVAIGHADHLDRVARSAIQSRRAAGGIVGIVGMRADNQHA
jgi:hypothetical protein